MRTTAAFLFVVLTLALACDTVAAGSSLDEGIVRLEIQDQRSFNCALSWIRVCQLGIANTSNPEQLEVDANQNISYVGIGVGIDPIIPVSIEYRLHGRDGHIPNPVFPFAGATWMESPLAPGVPHVFEARFENQAIVFNYNSINLSNPSEPIYWNEFGLGFPDGHGRIGYHQIGPFNELGASDSDIYLRVLAEQICLLARENRECYDGVSSAAAWQSNHTPNARFGLSFYEFHAASNSSIIGNESAGPAWAEPAVSPWFGAIHDVPVPSFTEAQPPPPPAATLQVAPQPASVEIGFGNNPDRFSRDTASRSAGPGGDATVRHLAAVVVGSIGLLLLAAILYARIRSKNEVIASAMRSRLLDAIRERPGLSPAALAKELGVTRNGVMHHVRVLQRAGLIAVTSEGRKTFLYVGRAQMSPIPGLIGRSGAAGTILSILQRAPEGLTKPELVAETPDLPKRTRNHALRQLLERGLLSLTEGPEPRFRIANP